MPQDAESLSDTCNLAAAEYLVRVTWIEDLNASALCSYQRHGSRIELRYRPSAAAKVREFIRRERECCSFLHFTIEEGDNELVVIINAPAELGPAADIVFAGMTS